MTRRSWVYINGEAIEKGEYDAEPAAHYVMNDIQPYQSMIDGSMITSRSRHREHLQAHGCIEVGNEKMQNRAPAPVESQRRDILRQQVGNMTHKEANRILSKLRNDARFTRR